MHPANEHVSFNAHAAVVAAVTAVTVLLAVLTVGVTSDDDTDTAVVASAASDPASTTLDPPAASGDPWAGLRPAVDAYWADVVDYTRAVAEYEWYAGVIAEQERQRAAAEAAERRRQASLSERPPTPSPSQSAPQPAGSGGVWEALARCESGGNWAINTGNGYYGGLQFSLSSWRAVGGVGYPHQASRAEQMRRGEMLRAQGGWAHWPSCARQLGLL